jgi:hypothetical protein
MINDSNGLHSAVPIPIAPGVRGKGREADRGDQFAQRSEYLAFDPASVPCRQVPIAALATALGPIELAHSHRNMADGRPLDIRLAACVGSGDDSGSGEGVDCEIF